ncbi:hypothetical protein S58_56270 [Bradyrhizobium oligotrophicum S58]|uniref:Uncharacterized protein n=1 Tax=Bradyrhizobium oligotrophicum S58 TaxID=1245469 RepID=M4ZCY3_9BRAD|nr:hypothetical protein S58_56270 [Bradyrhizobium oligotrophicum S58]
MDRARSGIAVGMMRAFFDLRLFIRRAFLRALGIEAPDPKLLVRHFVPSCRTGQEEMR